MSDGEENVKKTREHGLVKSRALVRLLIVHATLLNGSLVYWGFGYFRENFIFANSIKRHISDVKKSRLRQDLPLSINDRVISPFREGLIFTKLRICEVSRK